MHISKQARSSASGPSGPTRERTRHAVSLQNGKQRTWQAGKHLSVWIVKWRVKRRLRGARITAMRAGLNPDPYTVRFPCAFRLRKSAVFQENGLTEPAAKTVLLYCMVVDTLLLAASHRPSPWRLRSRDSRSAPDYRLAPENQFPAAVDDAVAAFVVSSVKDIRPSELWSAGILRARSALRSCSRFAIQGFRFSRSSPFSPWTDLPRRENLCAQTRRCHVQWSGHRSQRALLLGRQTPQPAGFSSLRRSHRSSAASSCWR